MTSALVPVGALLAMALSSPARGAFPVEENGVLVGLDDLQVTVGAETRNYDVRFVNGTCAEAHGACTEDNFTFLLPVGASGVDARDASSILANAIPESFRNDVTRIRGCEVDAAAGVALCTVLTTGAIFPGTGGGRVSYGSYRVAPTGSGLAALNNGAAACDFSTAGSNVVWAVWRLSSDGTPGQVGTADSDVAGENLFTECPVPPPVKPDLDQGLVAYYPFSGDAADASGNGNDGTVIGATLTADRFGNAGRAYHFDGFSSYISVPSSPSLASPESGLTLNAWFRADAWSSTGSDFGPLLMKSETSVNDLQYRLAVTPRGVNGAVNEFLNFVEGGPAPPFDEWHMATFVVFGNEATVYYDGQPVASGTINAPILDDTQPLEIGRDTPGLLEYFDGVIDEVRVYNRALSAEEIDRLYDYYEVPLNSVFLRVEEAVGVSDGESLDARTTVDISLVEGIGVTDETVASNPIDIVSIRLVEGIGVSDGSPLLQPRTTVDIRIEEGIGVADAAGERDPDTVLTEPIGQPPTAGLELIVEALGFMPFSLVQLFIESTPVLIGEGTADEFGRVRITAQVPDFFSPGAHTLVLVGEDMNGAPRTLRQAVTVRQDLRTILLDDFEPDD
ncbi:MAG: LamG domain-containing protein [Xanthomonadales bacterium]|jgi:hypothetical protein|nr:LamG domain-containing protein [Xanthomonadales bacterium]